MALKKILVAHDFSAPADHALAFAARLAGPVGASLDVVHVHPDVYDGHSTPALGLPWPSADQEARYVRFLDGEVQRAVEEVLGAEAARTVCRHIVRGVPAKRLVAACQELGADLLCVGSTGKGAVQRLLLGSVSQVLLRTSPVPVLMVH
jgi:nucleotide-binding universal stress UspA family protein